VTPEDRFNDLVEQEFAKELARAWVELDNLNRRAESEIAAGGDLNLTREDRDMLGEMLADHIEDIARLLSEQRNRDYV
jgi:hypothetical protein